MKSIPVIAILAAGGLVGCVRAPAPAPQTHTEVKILEDGALQRPQAESVVVLVPPSAPQLVARQEARIAAEQEQTEGRIHALMERYTDNLGNAKQKAQLGEEISQELAAYKRHSLALYKLQQHTRASH